MDECRGNPERRKMQLRDLAEQALTQVRQPNDERPLEEVVHELRVHQIELEMQNESLRQAEMALEESRDRYLDLYEFAPVGYLTLNGMGMIAEANLTAANLLGFERKHLLMRRFDQMVSVGEREQWWRQYVAMRANAGTWTQELELERGDGRSFPAHLDCLRVANGEGGLRITLSDISGRKTAERALQESEQRFRSLFEHSMDAILLMTPQGDVLAANPAAQRIFGYSEEELCGLGRLGLVDASDPRLPAGLAERVKVGRFSGELCFIGRGGRKFPVDLTSSVFLTQDGQRMTSMFFRDISERQAQERELATLREDLHHVLEWQVARQTIAAMAHELNQPLSSITALCTAAQRMLAPDRATRPERLPETMRQMSADALRAGGVVRQLLASLRSPDTLVAAVALAPLLRKSARAARDQGGADCQLAIDCTDDLPAVMVNSVQVAKVLLNLIGNGVEAMRATAGKRIRIHAGLAENEDAVCVSVSDDGPGVAPGMERDIFQPFVSGKPDGLGMGLAISRSLVEMQGGKLWHDAAAGPGATFRFTLPIAR